MAQIDGSGCELYSYLSALLGYLPYFRVPNLIDMWLGLFYLATNSHQEAREGGIWRRSPEASRSHVRQHRHPSSSARSCCTHGSRGQQFKADRLFYLQAIQRGPLVFLTAGTDITVTSRPPTAPSHPDTSLTTTTVSTTNLFLSSYLCVQGILYNKIKIYKQF